MIILTLGKDPQEPTFTSRVQPLPRPPADGRGYAPSLDRRESSSKKENGSQNATKMVSDEKPACLSFGLAP